MSTHIYLNQSVTELLVVKMMIMTMTERVGSNIS